MRALVRDVAGDGDDDVVGRIDRPVVRDERAPRDRRDHVRAADHRPAERVTAEDRLGDHVVDEILRVVVHHRDLLEHDLALGVELGERGRVDHPDHHVERLLEPLVGHAREQQRRLARGGGVQLSAQLVEDLGDLLRRVRVRPLEQQVLDEVRDAGARVRLVPRAGADPEPERDRTDARDRSLISRSPVGSVESSYRCTGRS